MVREEYPYNGNNNLIRHYSDDNKTVIQVETGNEYGEAIDNYPCKYTYVEGNPIDPVDDPATAEDYEAALSKFGVVTDE